MAWELLGASKKKRKAFITLIVCCISLGAAEVEVFPFGNVHIRFDPVLHVPSRGENCRKVGGAAGLGCAQLARVVRVLFAGDDNEWWRVDARFGRE